MSRDPILGKLDRDLACAVALSIVEAPHIVVNLESVTLHDERMRPLGTERDWLRGNDPLDAVTRDYLTARRAVNQAGVRRPGQTGWAAASSIRAREEAIRKAQEMRDLGFTLLCERGLIAWARRTGLKLLVEV